MKKNLYSIITTKLKQRGLTFELTRECNDKFKGYLIDDNTKVKMAINIQKSLQINYFDIFCDMVRDMMDMHIKLENMEVK